MTTIYVDVLILVNIYVNYFLIKTTNVFMHRDVKNIRCVIGAFIGSLFSLIILAPSMGFISTLLIKLIAAFTIILVTYGYPNSRTYLRISLIFFVINFVFAGVMLGLWLLVYPVNMFYKNGSVYFDISFITLALSTIIAYFIVKAIRYALDYRAGLDRRVTVGIDFCKNKVEVNGFVDSGNTLMDTFSGMPVIICDYGRIESILPIQYREVLADGDYHNIENLITTQDSLSGIRLLPFSTINSSGIIPAFKADNIYIKGEGMRAKPVKALIGISNNSLKGEEYGAILSPKLLI